MRFTLSAALLFFTGIIGSYAQGYKEKFADSEYSKGHYSVALGFYKEILSEDSTDVHAEVNLADCYRRLYDYKNAEIAYKKLIDSHTGLDPEIYRYYAETLANNKKYPESEVWFKKYNQMNNADSRSQNYLQTYTKFGSISADSALYKVEITNINSTATDFGPMYYKKGLVFCSGRHLSEGVKRVFSYDQSAFLDLYYVDDLSTLRNANVNLKSDTLSTKKKEIHHHDLDHSDFSEATSNDSRTVGTYHVHKLDSSANAAVKPFDDHINSKYHEGPVTFYNGEDSMIFTRNNQLKNKVGQDAAGRTKLKLYTAVHTEKGWDKIRDLPFNNDEYSVGQPALSPDNKKLYFVSDMPGGIGGTDLYVSEYTGGQWGKPVNMGKSVNTEGNEMFPFIDHDGNMYFASNGHGGFGGLDIFFYNMNGPGKVAVKNIGTPLNSPADDFGIIIDKGKRSGYFASNRLHGGTDDNIYSFRSTVPQRVELVGLIESSEKSLMDSATVIIVKNNSDTTITDQQGAFYYTMQPDNLYRITVKKKGFTDLHDSVSTKGISKGEVKVKYTMNKIPDEKIVNIAFTTDSAIAIRKEEGTLITIDSVPFRRFEKYEMGDLFFYFDRYDLIPDQMPVIQNVLKIMKNNPGLYLEINTYTDSRGSFDYNKQLSMSRLNACMEYLVSHGIDKSRIVTMNYGESKLFNNCKDGVNCSDRQHLLNRRAQFIPLLKE